MRWLFIIVVSITSCLAGGEHPTLRHEKPSNVASTKNNTLADYQLVPLPRSFFCHPPRAQEGSNTIKLKKAVVKSNRMDELKDPVIAAGLVLFLLIGSIMLFPVYYLFRIAAGFTGLITSIYLTCELHGFFNPNIIHFQVSLIWIGIPVGLAATIAFGYFYKVAMYTLTFMAGWLIVVFWSTIALTTDDIFKHLLLRDSVSLAFGLLFAISTRFFESVFVCISLPFLGAYFIGLGVDLIYQTGLVYTFGTSICFYEPLPKYTQQSIIAICIVTGLWFIGAGAYLVAMRGRLWGLNIQRICTEEEQLVPSSK